MNGEHIDIMRLDCEKCVNTRNKVTQVF